MTKPTIYEVDGCYFQGCEHFILQRFDALKMCTTDLMKKIVIQLRVLLQRRYDTQYKRLEEGGYHIYRTTECSLRNKLKNISFTERSFQLIQP